MIGLRWHRRIRYTIDRPGYEELKNIVKQHLPSLEFAKWSPEVGLANEFLDRQEKKQEVATDQLLNAVYLLIGRRYAKQRRIRPICER